jgi:hypothetical protein
MAVAPAINDYVIDPDTGRPMLAPLPGATIRFDGLPDVEAVGGGMQAFEDGDGGATFTFDNDRESRLDLSRLPHDFNLARMMRDDELSLIAADLLEGIQADITSRKDWEDLYLKGIKLLGLKIDKEKLPFTDACAVVHPLLMEAVIRFQSEAQGELLPAEGPVKAWIADDATEELEEIASEVAEAFNFYLTETAEEYYPEFEQMLFYLPLCGTTFKKIYNCPMRRRPVSDFVLPDDLIVSYTAASIERAPRVSHRTYPTRSEMRRLQLMKFYRDVDLGQPHFTPTPARRAVDAVEGRRESIKQNADEPFTVYEVQCERILPDRLREGPPGLPLPYTVTVEETGRKVLRIERGWAQDDRAFKRRPVPGYVKYSMFPGLGFYDFGLTHLVGNTTDGATQILREIVDGGMFASFPAGVRVKGARLENNTFRPGPGEWPEIDTGSLPINQAFMPLPYKEPSVVLANTLDKIVASGERVAGTAALPVGEGRQDAPVGTTLALLEQAIKPTSAVLKRAHRSQRREFKLLRKLFMVNPGAIWEYQTPAGQAMATGEMFGVVHVIPVSDPNIPSQAQRLLRVDALSRLKAEDPDLFDRRKTKIRQMKLLNIGDGEALMVPPPQEAVPMDPASENIAALQGMPLRADIAQDHLSHIQSHVPILMSPATKANPQAAPALAAHIVEHYALHYRMLIESLIDMPLPPPGQPLPPPVERVLSQLIAEVTDVIQAEMQKMAVGPLGMDENLVKLMDTQVKAAKIAADARTIEIENKIQLAELRAQMAKHRDEMENAQLKREDRERDRRARERDNASKERIAEIKRRADEAKANIAARRATARGKSK